jgi:O-antigen ligase
MLLCIVLTFSRSGLLALVVGCSFLIAMHLRPAVIKRVLIGVGGGFLVLALAYNTVKPVKKILQPAVLRITQITDTRVESVGARFVAYEAAIGMVSDHPYFGVGPDVFPYEYDVRTGILAPEKHVVPHNLMLEIISEKGLIGLSLYLCFILTLVYTIRRSLQQLEPDDAVTRAVLQWILAWLPAFFTLTLFLTGMYEVYFWLLTGIVYAISTRLPWRQQS